MLVFAVGAVGDIAFRARAPRLGRRAALIWRTHLLFTTALLVAWLFAGTQAEMTQQVVTVVYGTAPLMVFAHGAALAAGAVIMRELGTKRG